MKLYIGPFCMTALAGLGLSIADHGIAYAACNSAELIDKVTYTDSSGYNEINFHNPQDYFSDCAVDYYATSIWDIYNVFGPIMPTFHFSEETKGGLDGVTFYYPHSADFSNASDISGVAINVGGLPGNNAFLFKGGSPIGTSNQGEVSVTKVDKAGTANDYTLIKIDTDLDTAPEAVIRLKGLKNLAISNFVM